MKYKIDTSQDEVNINISDTNGKQDQLLKAFQACQEGHCSCPTQEYTKLDAMEIECDGNSMHLRLTPKADKTLDLTEIGKCLKHTRDQLAEDD